MSHIKDPVIADGTLVAIDAIQVMHCDLACEQIHQPVEVGPFPERSGFACTCVDDKTGASFVGSTPEVQTNEPSFEAPGPAGSGSSLPAEDELTDEDAVRLIKGLPQGQKFTHEDMTRARVRFAESWLKAYKGEFEFLVDVRDNMTARGLSSGQAKGVWNCIRAAFYRGEFPEGAKAKGAGRNDSDLDLSSLPAGMYAVPGGDTRLKVRIDQPVTGKWAGYTFVKDGAEYGQQTRYGMQKPGQAYRGQIQDALRIIAADPRAASAAYGRLVGRCGVCGAHLEDEESVARGIGPICAQKF